MKIDLQMVKEIKEICRKTTHKNSSSLLILIRIVLYITVSFIGLFKRYKHMLL